MVHQGGGGFSENVKIFDPLQILQEIFAPPPLSAARKILTLPLTPNLFTAMDSYTSIGVHGRK